MVRKVRQLEADLLRAGFEREQGKGSHRKYRHPKGQAIVTIAGKGGDDAKPYQERQVAEAIEKASG